MKKVLKNLVVAILGWQVRRLQGRNGSFKTIGVVGSYGKTSSKMAVAEMLETELHVQYQKGNYNDTATVPLVFFGQALPSLFNPFAWVLVFLQNERMLAREVYPFEAVVVELGIDGPGQMEEFKKFLKLDYALVTALGPEHMEQFKDLEQVATEELKVQEFAQTVIVNEDLCDKSLLKSLKKPYESYSLDYAKKLPLDSWRIRLNEDPALRLDQTILSKARLYSLSAAVVMALKFGISEDKIKSNLSNIKMVPGRMNTLKGKKGATIIDDTYNASPEATILALNTLYSYPARQRIALLGNMNELGKFSEEMHRQVGHACEPGKLDLVVTLGEHANKYLAEQAEKAGCKVERIDSPYQAAEVIEEALKKDSVVLAKGSQNGVFAEEAVKMLLKNPTDNKYLVRQTETWLARKEKNLGKNPWLE